MSSNLTWTSAATKVADLSMMGVVFLFLAMIIVAGKYL
jgi:hypothetical protein